MNQLWTAAFLDGATPDATVCMVKRRARSLKTFKLVFALLELRKLPSSETEDQQLIDRH